MPLKQEVAIIGYACRMPGARNSQEFWQLLQGNRCSVTSITPDRFATAAFFHPAIGQSGRSYTFAAGVIDDVWGFDAAAFGMSPREAVQVDPQHRHLLEVSYDAIGHAGLRPSSLADSDTGVYVGASSVDHAARFFADPAVADVHMMTGNTLSVLANRISHALDLRGPSLTLDTACSSSLVALHLAAEAIRRGEIDTAIVAGANLLLSPFSYIGFSQASMLSPTGLCRPFDAAADGYVRSEGIVAIVLRSLPAAHKSRNRIHGVIVGSGMNQDGKTTGLSLPSAASQRRLLDRVYSDFGVDPADLLFVEAHGTGTRVGDPIEAEALGNALGRQRAQPLPIGSVKSNVGHLEPVSGLAGLLKALHALNHSFVPATLHYTAPNADIPFDELNLRVVARNWQPPEQAATALAGINSFGFGGTNAHAILRSDKSARPSVFLRAANPPPPLLLTAHTAQALPAVAAACDDHWPSDNRAAVAFIGANAHGKDMLPHRALFRGGTPDEVRHHVRGFAQGSKSALTLSGHAVGTDLPVGFLFSGNGSQWAGMGRAAWHANVHFRRSLEEIDCHFVRIQQWSIIDRMFDPDLAAALRRTSCSQPLLLALQIATVKALEHAGVTPAATLGHSVGEVAAAWAAGALSLEQAIEVVHARSRHQEAVRGGAMASLMLSEKEARHFLMGADAPDVEIAAINSWRNVTVSGTAPQIETVMATAATMRISARRLDLDYPFHSALVEPVRAPLLRDLEGVRPLAPAGRMISTVTGDVADAAALGAEYWWRNIREPVRFEAGITRLLRDDVRVFVEIGPAPILLSYVRDILREAGVRGETIETLSEKILPEGTDAIERAASKVFLAGGKVNLARFIGPAPEATIDLPPYPWQHTAFRVEPTREANTVLMEAAHPLLGRRPRLDCAEWFSTVDPILLPWLQDHKVGPLPVFPAAAYVEIMLAAGRDWLGAGALELRDLDIARPLAFKGDSSFETLVRMAPETGLVEFMSRPRDGHPDWALNARGVVRRSPVERSAASLPEIRPGTIVVGKPEVYAWAKSLGFDYGPAFQRIRRVEFPHPKHALATLDPPAAAPSGNEVIDITAFDTAFHALFASDEAGVADMPMKRMLPVHFDCVRIYVPGATAAFATVRILSQSANSLLADIQLYDSARTPVLTAARVRLVTTPSEGALDPASMSYHAAVWQLERAGLPAPIPWAADGEAPKKPSPIPIEEALTLLEAGSLRAGWEALTAAGLAEPGGPSEAGPSGGSTDAEVRPFLRSALFGHLAARGLAGEEEGRQRVCLSCALPDLGSIVTSLTTRHPTTVTEAASLAQIAEILPRLLTGDRDPSAPFTAAHWRQLGVASSQIVLLGQAVVAELEALILQYERGRLLRVLMIGCDHIAVASGVIDRFPNVELSVTDTDPDRLEQVRSSAGDDVARIQYLSWAAIGDLAAGSMDIVFAIDGLSELAIVADNLGIVARAMRPGSPLIAGEMAPSLFWDLVRGTRRQWWARSATPEFPVGALLEANEWVDDIRSAGFDNVAASPVYGEARIGVVIKASAPRRMSRREMPPAQGAVFSFEGDAGDEASIGALRRHVQQDMDPGPVPATDAAVAMQVPRPVEPTDTVWTIDARTQPEDMTAALSAHLDQIAGLCRQRAQAPGSLWIVIDFGDAAGDESPLHRPLWCAVTAAMRVAQNEYPGVPIRCLGLADSAHPATIASARAEFLAPDGEREIFIVRGRRLVFRLQRGTTTASRPALAEGRTLTLVTRRASAQGRLQWTEQARRAPGAGEVEIEVAATGLNFRDVMWNLGMLPEEAVEGGYIGAELGMECAGTIGRIGAGVTAFKTGDRVLAFVPRAFSSHVVARAHAVSAIPPGLGVEAASTIPVAFLTAYYSLIHLGRLGRGETVLMHGGAGAVGLAAIQIARHAGATVIATAGSEEKRAFLRQYGADFVCSSRNLSFAEEVVGYTRGRGVDIVVNSLAGEAMVRSLDCLRPFGRFIELGKRDLYANTHIGLRPMRRNLSYFGVDINQLVGDNAGLTRELVDKIMGLFATGELTPLPYRVFAGDRTEDAFRSMQSSHHIGKIVVTPPPAPSAAGRGTGTFRVDTGGTHVVVGGTGGFGLATAEWLAGRGATRLALVSRSGRITEADEQIIATLRRKRVDVTVDRVDVTDAAALQAFLRRTDAAHPVRGIVHAAMVLDDRLIDGIDRRAIETVLHPKVTGALALEHAVDGLALDYLLFYSSATTLFGNPGQYNYVAANGFIEGMARRLRARGVPALAIAWGGIENAGYLARNIAADANLKRRFASNLMTAETALDGLDWTFDGDGRQTTACCAIARIDWSMARRELAVTHTPAFGAIGTSTRITADTTAVLEKLRALPAGEIADAVLDIVVEEIARVLRVPPKELDRHKPLAEIGMDSLMMLELRTTVEAVLHVELPMMSLSSGITPADIARRVAPLVTGDSERSPLSGTLVRLSSSHFADETETVSAGERQAAIGAVLARVRRLDAVP